MSKQWYNKQWVGIFLHVQFWILFFISPYLLRPVWDDSKPTLLQVNYMGFVYLLFLNNIIRLLLFYSNVYLFIPKLVYKKKYTVYVLVLLAAFGIMLICDMLFFNWLIIDMQYSVRNFLVFNILPFSFIIVASAAFRMIRDRIEEDKLIKERETENLKTELSFLRSQVSPHFMFNVLNNMVALARKKSDALEPSLIKLSSLLRYMLYETDEDKVLLEKEIEYLQSYIDLQKQRFGKNIVINASFQNVENGYTIEPMLLIPFVENAFKHGTGIIADAQIDIHLSVQNAVLDFSVRNRYNNEVSGNVTEVRDKTSGIGLNNVKRRLNLLYYNNHALQIDKKNGWFTVSLQLNLH